MLLSILVVSWHLPTDDHFFTLATGMLGFAGKICQTPEVDPYLGVGDDTQVYTKYQADIKDYGSDIDQQAVTSSLINLRKVVSKTEEHIFDIIVRVLASSTGLWDVWQRSRL
ncbi:protein SEMI-ROLLED LEAF 2-like isoform X2 [Dioscorea cayenensis subsp. rotundata]|uniref:Protein SEMI-ROLLED LEAF 2-like isoform X2 n=1 Tax=Dioscorea cayennensis subsp. rotundata TaxID=55577 RepID=A0AB40CS62_DIOCR|nr:protein SEMI-ROLLED LEAF 2-like isoform X2 [Dioscorea cayenensis subsp. rotundata]